VKPHRDAETKRATRGLLQRRLVLESISSILTSTSRICCTDCLYLYWTGQSARLSPDQAKTLCLRHSRLPQDGWGDNVKQTSAVRDHLLHQWGQEKEVFFLDNPRPGITRALVQRQQRSSEAVEPVRSWPVVLFRPLWPHIATADAPGTCSPSMRPVLFYILLNHRHLRSALSGPLHFYATHKRDIIPSRTISVTSVLPCLFTNTKPFRFFRAVFLPFLPYSPLPSLICTSPCTNAHFNFS
jgi:hypothetical protein